MSAGLFIGSLWAFYYTDLFRWSLYEHAGHIWMVAHFVITGYLFALTLLDEIPCLAASRTPDGCCCSSA